MSSWRVTEHLSVTFAYHGINEEGEVVSCEGGKLDKIGWLGGGWAGSGPPVPFPLFFFLERRMFFLATQLGRSGGRTGPMTRRVRLPDAS